MLNYNRSLCRRRCRARSPAAANQFRDAETLMHYPIYIYIYTIRIQCTYLHIFCAPVRGIKEKKIIIIKKKYRGTRVCVCVCLYLRLLTRIINTYNVSAYYVHRYGTKREKSFSFLHTHTRRIHAYACIGTVTITHRCN